MSGERRGPGIPVRSTDAWSGSPSRRPSSPSVSAPAAPGRRRPVVRAVSILRVKESDFKIVAPKRIRAGAVEVLARNRGPDDHELIIVRENGTRLPFRTDGFTIDEDALEPREGRGARAIRRCHGRQAASSSDPWPLRPVLQHGRPLPRRHAHDAGGRVAMLRNRRFHPFATRGRRTIGAILLTFGLFSALSVTLSIRAASRSQNQAVGRRARRTAADARRALRQGAAARPGGSAGRPGAIAALLSRERERAARRRRGARRSKETTTRRP